MSVAEDLDRWLADHWDPELGLREWRAVLVDSGWARPAWPGEWWGMGLPPADAAEAQRVLAEAEVVGPPSTVAVNLVAPTILQHGSDLLRSTFLRPALVGDHAWTQLFSEPGAGSDLAGVTTRAERRAELPGDTWIVNGHKVWNSGAQDADHGLLLARTDWDVPKHRGLTCLVVDMRAAGVHVRPLPQMNGYATFSEVVLTDVRVPAEHVLGEVGGGWAVVNAMLANERSLGAGAGTVPVPGNVAGRCRREAAEEAARAARHFSWYPQRYGRADLVAAARSADPLVRQQIARVVTLARIAAWSAGRARANLRLGRVAGAEGSLAKLMTSELARAAAVAHAQLAGPDVLLGDTLTAEILLSVPAVSIAGGTDEIQKNIVAERVLGLPKDPTSDAHVPFRDVRRNGPAEPSGAELSGAELSGAEPSGAGS
ncbi:acyl-CoA dehydrogenase family protein [Pseudonocardia ailaonensis]|uniref:acyl-CoA dehydrogenase family protein n=1 Tax=Pseudonocardia ailaonensis TaxID=367279 RepID=UPI0031D83EA1